MNAVSELINNRRKLVRDVACLHEATRSINTPPGWDFSITLVCLFPKKLPLKTSICWKPAKC